MKKICLIVCCLSITLLLAGCGRGDSSSKDLVVVGSGAPEVILRKLAEAFNKTNPGYKVIVPKSIGSGGGIKTVGNDEYFLGRVARPLKKSEAHFGLTYVPFAKDLVVFAAGKNVDIKSLTPEQILDIYSGKITGWEQVGGRKAHIRTLAREKSETSAIIIARHLPGFKKLVYGKQIKLIYHDYAMVDALCKFPTSIGWLTCSSVKPGFKPVAYNGIAPTAQNGATGKYPFALEYAFIYKKDRLNTAAKKFMDFVKSGQGKKILEANGLSAVE